MVYNMTTQSKAWKVFERRVAAELGTFRTPLSGGSSRHTRSDTLHSDLYVEVKWSGIINNHGGKQITIKRKVLMDALKFAKDEGKAPMIVFGFKQQTDMWAIIPFEVAKLLYLENIDIIKKMEGVGEDLYKSDKH